MINDLIEYSHLLVKPEVARLYDLMNFWYVIGYEAYTSNDKRALDMAAVNHQLAFAFLQVAMRG